MKKVLKKLTVLLFITVMVFSFSTSASAATYPTATRLSAETITCKRGQTVKLKFKLRSNSYAKYGNIWRSYFLLRMYNPGGRFISSKVIYFTGTINQTVSLKIPNTFSTGLYSVNYRTIFNSNIYSYKWYSNNYTTNKWCYIRVK